jgi:hypothetical protein
MAAQPGVPQPSREEVAQARTTEAVNAYDQASKKPISEIFRESVVKPVREKVLAPISRGLAPVGRQLADRDEAGGQFVRGLVRSTPLHAPLKAPPATREEASQSLIDQGLVRLPLPATPTDDPTARNAVARQRAQEAAQAYHANEQARQQAAVERQRGTALLPDKWDRMIAEEARGPSPVGLTPHNIGTGLQALHESVSAPIGRGIAKVPGAIWTGIKATGGEGARTGRNFMQGWNWMRGLRR